LPPLPTPDGTLYGPDRTIRGHSFLTTKVRTIQREAALWALEEAAKAFEAEANTWAAWPQAGAARRKGSAAIRALKENIE
jgi:hypothetical protein